MIGLDRPVKPEWIYQLLNIIKVGTKPSEYNEVFENIAVELTGKEGKRKVRTIIYRNFIYSFQKTKTKIEPNIFIELSNKKDLNFLKPIFLAKILFDYDICRFVVPKFYLLKNDKNEINLSLISKKMVQEYGDRDVVKRSVRSFIKTLSFFNYITLKDKSIIILNEPIDISTDQWSFIIQLYSEFFLKSKFIDIENFHQDLFFYLNKDSFYECIKENHGEKWEYIRDHSRNILIFK
ncbi:MAG: hypothetical protein RBR08_12325 [Desulforegulaceae bacterium]|nr:hypothetical protein [Desulforegulaceae bacterium]